MNLTPEENLLLRRACQEITYKPRPIEAQPHARQDAFLWCEDWEMIEVLKFFFLGEHTYFAEPPPRRLRNNPLWSKDSIKAKAEALLENFGGNLEAIVGHLKITRAAAPGLG